MSELVSTQGCGAMMWNSFVNCKALKHPWRCVCTMFLTQIPRTLREKLPVTLNLSQRLSAIITLIITTSVISSGLRKAALKGLSPSRQGEGPRERSRIEPPPHPPAKPTSPQGISQYFKTGKSHYNSSLQIQKLEPGELQAA